MKNSITVICEVSTCEVKCGTTVAQKMGSRNWEFSVIGCNII